MILIGNTAQQIVNLLNSNSASLGGTAQVAFPTTKIPLPLNENYFAVGVLSTALGKRIVETVDDEPVQTTNRLLTLTIGITIYSSASSAGSSLYNTFDKVMDTIIHQGAYNAVSAGCSDIEYSTAVGANYIKAFVTLNKIVNDMV